MIDALPAQQVGRCVVDGDRDLFHSDVAALRLALREGRLRFRAGAIGGAMPTLITS